MATSPLLSSSRPHPNMNVGSGLHNQCRIGIHVTRYIGTRISQRDNMKGKLTCSKKFCSVHTLHTGAPYIDEHDKTCPHNEHGNALSRTQ